MIEIIKNKGQWNSVLRVVDNYDFYHTHDYHSIAKGEFEEAVLIKYTENDVLIAIPLLIRKIPGSSYFDATSVYGYPGPIVKNINGGFDNSNFIRELNELFADNKVVTVFSRLNPFICNQEVVLKNLGEIVKVGKVVNMDLKKDLIEQRKNYSKRLKTYINKARRTCSVTKANTEQEILQFIEMYYENMRRVNALNRYFFKKDYFFRLLKSKDFQTDILLAHHLETKEIIGGAMFVRTNGILQYHLSGSKEKFLDLNPIKLLIDEMMVLATEENYEYFNLGGGVGNKKEDTLFKFKSGFSKDFRPFELWEYIVNESVYEDLVIKKQSSECAKLFKNCTDYFPCYRCNIDN